MSSQTTAYITHRECALHEMGAHHPECPERLAAIHDALLARGLLDVLHSYEAPQATDEQILRAHSESHLARLCQLSPRAPLLAVDDEFNEPVHDAAYAMLDGDTIMNPHTLKAALHAAGGAVLATDLVLQKQVRNAFVAVRPPGHHAEHDRAMGFCFLNNVAIAAHHALEHYGVERIAVIDFDVHHGNGTENILANDTRTLMVSTFALGLYPHSGEQPLGSNMHNVGLRSYTNGDFLRQAYAHTWLPALTQFAPQMLFISAGFDAHREDDLGTLAWVESDYRWVTQQLCAFADAHCEGRVVSVLEGGYCLRALANSVVEHVKALADVA